jgi:hypothetical protein
MKHLAALVALLVVAGCTALGLAPPNLAVDCDAQATIVNRATADVKRLGALERSAIDAEIALSAGYCNGTVAADPAAASRAVEASTTHIAAIVAVAELRP